MATPLTQLTMHSEATDFIGQGRDYFFDLTNTSSFTLTTYDYNRDGHPNVLFAQILTPTTFWNLLFGTDGLGEITEGFYSGARGAPGIGQPLLSVGGDGRGDSNTTGEFTVIRAFFPSVTHAAPAPPGSSFAVTFRQNCCGTPALNGNLFGTLYYNYDPEMAPVPEPSDILLTSGGILSLMLARRVRKSVVHPNVRA